MTRRHHFLLHALTAWVLLGTPTTVSAQSNADVRGLWSVGVSGGFLVPHRASMRALIQGHAERMDLTWSRKARGFWALHRHAPSWGLSLHALSSGADDHVGHQVAALGFADLRLQGRMHIRIGGGLGWTELPWDAESTPGRERVVIGSHINGAAQLGLHWLPLVDAAQWHEHIGLHLRLDHQSNASYNQPNLGTNVLSAGLSAAVASSRAPRVVPSGEVISILPRPVQGVLLYTGVGRRQPAPLAEREMVAEWGGDFRFGGGARFSWVVGGLLMSRPETLGSSLHGGFQLTFMRAQLDFLHGRYLHRWQPEEPHYNRVVFNVHVRKGWWSRIGLHTHGFRAHHPTLGIAWVPGNRSPHAPLK